MSPNRTEPDDDDLTIGRMEKPLGLIKRYALLERMGHGSMGVLYRGRDTVLDREVAVKVMAQGLLGDVEAHTRFFREAKAAARLQHVNIVTVFEFGEHDGTPYIVMEFLRGHSLSERLRQEPAMSLQDKLDVAIQLCAGLEAAHTQGVVHRDLKPGNAWICPGGTVKLLDFGIATAASSSATIDLLGSPNYISPEQVAGKEVDRRTDIYSAGAVLYEMLCGRPPFEADSVTGVMLKIVNEDPEPIPAEVPPALASAVQRAMAKSPAARYERASEFGRELKAISADLPVVADFPTLMIDPTVVYEPTPIPAPKQQEHVAPPVLERLRQIAVGRPQVLIATIGILVILAAGALTWSLWPVKVDQKPEPPVISKKSDSDGSGAKTPGPVPPPVPGPAPGPTPVTLRVTSKPGAAKILLDGRDTGKTTPAEIQIDPSQPRPRIQLVMTGFKAGDVPITAEALQRGTIDVPLSPIEPVAKVTLVATGDYPFDVMDRGRVLSSALDRHDVVVSGLRTVQLRSDRYFLNQAVRVDRAQGGMVRATAHPLGSITIHAAGPMEDCKVFIDDRMLDSGSVTVSNRPIASGEHRVKLRCSRGDTEPQTVVIGEGNAPPIKFPANTPLRPR